MHVVIASTYLIVLVPFRVPKCYHLCGSLSIPMSWSTHKDKVFVTNNYLLMLLPSFHQALPSFPLLPILELVEFG